MDASSCLEEGSSDSEKRPPMVVLTLEGSVEGESWSKTKPPSSRYKGVVPQPNGSWGAQIYERHQRVWLGTFADEGAAAQAYDVASQRFRGRDAFTNFKPLSESDGEEAAELGFLEAHSKAEIVDMLRKHTYRDELQQSARRRARGGAFVFVGGDDSQSAREMLFDKAVTPSDVGKLNRLVLPKHHAEKHFPLRCGGGGDVAWKGMLLNLEDGCGRMWRFRYSYWNSSQSYVLTRGWSRFVREKNLKARDVVSFWRSTGPDNQLYIHCSTGGADVAPPLPTSVMLFGVNISGSLASGRDGKRGRDPMELLPSSQQRFEKQLMEAS